MQIKEVLRYRRCHWVLTHSGVPTGYAWILVTEAVRGSQTALLWIKLAFLCRHLAPAETWI